MRIIIIIQYEIARPYTTLLLTFLLYGEAGRHYVHLALLDFVLAVAHPLDRIYLDEIERPNHMVLYGYRKASPKLQNGDLQ